MQIYYNSDLMCSIGQYYCSDKCPCVPPARPFAHSPSACPPSSRPPVVRSPSVRLSPMGLMGPMGRVAPMGFMGPMRLQGTINSAPWALQGPWNNNNGRNNYIGHLSNECNYESDWLFGWLGCFFGLHRPIFRFYWQVPSDGRFLELLFSLRSACAAVSGCFV